MRASSRALRNAFGWVALVLIVLRPLLLAPKYLKLKILESKRRGDGREHRLPAYGTKGI
jgi:hypothetical protein